MTDLSQSAVRGGADTQALWCVCGRGGGASPAKTMKITADAVIDPQKSLASLLDFGRFLQINECTLQPTAIK